MRTGPIYRRFEYALHVFKSPEILMEDAAVMDLVDTNRYKFDLVMGEVVITHSLVYGFAHKHNAQVVVISPFIPNALTNSIVSTS